MTQKATVIAVVNQKGGTGKTTTCENLGIGLAMEGKKVLVVGVICRKKSYAEKLKRSRPSKPPRIIFQHNK